MEIAAAIIATVLLTVAAMAISRAGGDDHQEDLNEHDTAPGAGGAADQRGRPAEPKADRPAGPDAEAMGVADPGDPSTDPASELEGERIVDDVRHR